MSKRVRSAAWMAVIFSMKKVLDQNFFLNDHGLALLKQDNAKALVDVLMEEIATAEAERDSTEATRGNSRQEDEQAKEKAERKIERLTGITLPRPKRQLTEARCEAMSMEHKIAVTQQHDARQSMFSPLC